MLLGFHQVHLGKKSCGKNPPLSLRLDLVPLWNRGARRLASSLSALKVLSTGGTLLVALEKKVVMPKLKYQNSKNTF